MAVTLPAFVALAKQKAAFELRTRLRGSLWQKGYYERVLRDDEDSFLVARYIIQNPVRAGLAPSPDVYPFTGSSILTKEQLIESCVWSPRHPRRA